MSNGDARLYTSMGVVLPSQAPRPLRRKRFHPRRVRRNDMPHRKIAGNESRRHRQGSKLTRLRNYEAALRFPRRRLSSTDTGKYLMLLGADYADLGLVIAHEDVRPYEGRQISHLLEQLIQNTGLPAASGAKDGGKLFSKAAGYREENARERHGRRPRTAQK